MAMAFQNVVNTLSRIRIGLTRHSTLTVGHMFNMSSLFSTSTYASHQVC